MALSNKQRVIAALLCLLVASAAAVFTLRESRAPVAQLNAGVLLAPAQPLPDFQLINEHKQPVTKADLRGKWHLLSYGYTYCPDVCPTTLSTLVQLRRRLDELGSGQGEMSGELNFLFYTIDPQRDTPGKLADYMAYFGHRFTALGQPQPPQAKVFEQALGIKAQIYATPAEPDNYQVSHGLALYLINPRAELQAVFTPLTGTLGMAHFNLDWLLEDYLAVRREYRGDKR